MTRANAHALWGVVGRDATEKPDELLHSALHLGRLLAAAGNDLIAPVNLHALGRQIVRGAGDERRSPHHPQTILLQARGMYPQQRLLPGTVVENLCDMTRVDEPIITRADHIIALPAPDETTYLCRLFAADKGVVGDKDAPRKTMCIVGDKPDMYQDDDTPEFVRNLDSIQFFDSFLALEETCWRQIVDDHGKSRDHTAPTRRALTGNTLTKGLL